MGHLKNGKFEEDSELLRKNISRYKRIDKLSRGGRIETLSRGGRMVKVMILLTF